MRIHVPNTPKTTLQRRPPLQSLSITKCNAQLSHSHAWSAMLDHTTGSQRTAVPRRRHTKCTTEARHKGCRLQGRCHAPLQPGVTGRPGSAARGQSGCSPALPPRHMQVAKGATTIHANNLYRRPALRSQLPRHVSRPGACRGRQRPAPHTAPCAQQDQYSGSEGPAGAASDGQLAPAGPQSQGPCPDGSGGLPGKAVGSPPGQVLLQAAKRGKVPHDVGPCQQTCSSSSTPARSSQASCCTHTAARLLACTSQLRVSHLGRCCTGPCAANSPWKLQRNNPPKKLHFLGTC
jgi:hypothetical protein